MRIIVCAKQVPDTTEVRIDPVKGTLIRDGVPSILNPNDANALEAALQIKDNDPETTVTVISMGPPQATSMLRECLAMGADEAYLLSDRAFGGADTCATSTTIVAGIRAIGGADLILTGQQAIDGDTAQVGPQVAQRLGLPVVTYVQALRVEEDELVVDRQLEDGYERLQVKLPCVIAAIKELNTPRYMTIRGIVEAYEKEIKTLDHTAVGLSPEKCGLNASPTQVYRSFAPAVKGAGKRLEGTPAEMANELFDILRQERVL